MKIKLILISIFILLSSLSALSKAEIVKETLNCCKSQLASNRKDAIGLMLLHYLSTETTNNRDVLLLQAKIKRGLDIKSAEKGDLLKLSQLYERASAAYIRIKDYKKAIYYLGMAEKLNPLSDNALINQHLLQTKGFKVTTAQLLGPYGSGGTKPNNVKRQGNVNVSGNREKLVATSTTHGRFNAIKLPVNTITFKIAEHHYALILEKATWKQAKAKAESLGGYLACITSAEENELILKYVLRRNIWIGGTDEIKEGSFKWISGEQFNYNNFNHGEPNNSGREGEDFLGFQDGAWNDMPADRFNSGYLVEWNK